MQQSRVTIIGFESGQKPKKDNFVYVYRQYSVRFDLRCDVVVDFLFFDLIIFGCSETGGK